MTTRNFHWSSVLDCVMHETDGSGNTLVTYTHEPSQYGPLLSENRGSSESYHHYDALGSTMMLTDDTGAVTDTFTYDAWGNEVVRTGLTDTPYGWCGRWGYQYDRIIGEYSIRERSYQPIIARWMSIDPIEQQRRYRYVECSPVILIDPSGLVAVSFDPAAGVPHPWSWAFIWGAKGITSTRRFDIACYCESCPTMCKSYRIRCSIDAAFHIFIHQTRNAPFFTAAQRSGVYGHEQRHIENFRKTWVPQIVNYLETYERGCIKRNRTACDEEATEAVRYAKDLFILFSFAESRHTLPAPADGADYPVIGTMPPATSAPPPPDNPWWESEMIPEPIILHIQNEY